MGKIAVIVNYKRFEEFCNNDSLKCSGIVSEIWLDNKLKLVYNCGKEVEIKKSDYIDCTGSTVCLEFGRPKMAKLFFIIIGRR